MFRHKPDISKQMSVVIITRNRVKELANTLDHLFQMPVTVPVIVVDNNSTDGTLQMIRAQFPQVQLLPLKTNQGALARNVGAAAANTPYIAFCDDDSWWEGDSLVRAIKYFQKYPKVGVITGRILVKKQRKLDPTSAIQSISPLTPRIPMPGPVILSFLGCALIVRKKAYMQAGGYSKLLYFSGEEELLAYDIAASGWGMTYCDDIVGCHFPSKTRDLPRRYRLGSRNKVLRAWLRRPLSQAIKKTLQPEIHSGGELYCLIGWLQGIMQIPRMLKQRQVVPDWLEAQILELEAQNEELAQKAILKQRQHLAAQAATVS